MIVGSAAAAVGDTDGLICDGCPATDDVAGDCGSRSAD